MENKVCFRGPLGFACSVGLGTHQCVFFPFLGHFSLLSLFPSHGRAEPGVGNGAGSEQLPHRQKFPVFLPHLPMVLGHSPEFTSNFQPCTGPGWPSFGVMEKTLPLHPAKGEVELICAFPGGKAVFPWGKSHIFPGGSGEILQNTAKPARQPLQDVGFALPRKIK